MVQALHYPFFQRGGPAWNLSLMSAQENPAPKPLLAHAGALIWKNGLTAYVSENFLFNGPFPSFLFAPR